MMLDARRARQLREQSESEHRAIVKAEIEKQRQLLVPLHARYVEQICNGVDSAIGSVARYSTSLKIYEREQFYKDPAIAGALGQISGERREQLLPFDYWEDAPGIRELVKKLNKAGYRIAARRVKDQISDWGDYSNDQSDWYIEAYW